MKNLSARRLTPIRAIRDKCIDCSGGSVYEVERCVIPECSLYPYRMGKDPKRAGMGPKTPSFVKKKDR